MSIPGLVFPEVSDNGTVTKPTQNKREAIEELKQAEEDIRSYRCEECQAEYPDERLVRVHINRSTDEAHRNKSGFMPETHVEVLSESGEVLGRVPGSGNAHLDGVKQFVEGDCPDSLTTAEKVIITTAVRNPNVHPYSDVHRLVQKRYRKLEDELEISPTGYQKTYRTIRDYLNVEESTDAQNPTPQMTPEATQSGEQTEQKVLSTFRDLTEKKQVILLEHAINPDQTKKQIAETAGVSVAYPGQVLEDYSELKNALLELEELPPLTIELEDGEYSVTESIKQHELDKDAQASGEEKAYEDLTDTQQQVVDAIAQHPPGKHTNKEIADMADCFHSYVPRVKKEHADIIEHRRKEVFNLSEDVETSPEIRNKPAESYEDLTDKQKAVIDALREEDDPTNPDRTYKELAKAAGDLLGVSEEEYPHITHVRNTVEKYGELAVEIDEADEQTADSPLTWQNRRVHSASPYDEPQTSEPEDRSEPETQQQTIEPDEETVTGEITRDVVSEMSQEDISKIDEDVLERCNYRALQELAKPYQVNARQSEEGLREELITQLTEDESESEVMAPAKEVDEELDENLVTVPRDVLKALINQAGITKENAEREVELLGKDSVAGGRLVVAREWERSLKSLLEEHANSGDSD